MFFGFVLMLSCVYTFEAQQKGNTRVEIRQERVDFSEVEKKLDKKLLDVSSREERQKLKLLEPLAKQLLWPVEADFVKSVSKRKYAF